MSYDEFQFFVHILYHLPQICKLKSPVSLSTRFTVIVSLWNTFTHYGCLCFLIIILKFQSNLMSLDAGL